MEVPYLYGISFTVGGALFYFISIALFLYFFQNKNRNYLLLAFVFLLMTVHSLTTGIPVLLMPDNLVALSVFHIIGKIAAFFSIMVSVLILKNSALKTRPGIVRGIFSMLSFGVLITLLMFFITFPLPTVTDAIVIWNEHWFASLTSGFIFLIYGIVWGVLLYKEAMLLPKGKARTQTLILSFAGAAMSFAGFVGFTGGSSTQALVALMLVAAVAAVSFFGFFFKL